MIADQDGLIPCKACGNLVASGWLYNNSDLYCMNKCITDSVGEEVFQPLWDKWKNMEGDPEVLQWYVIWN